MYYTYYSVSCYFIVYIIYCIMFNCMMSCSILLHYIIQRGVMPPACYLRPLNVGQHRRPARSELLF